MLPFIQNNRQYKSGLYYNKKPGLLSFTSCDSASKVLKISKVECSKEEDGLYSMLIMNSSISVYIHTHIYTLHLHLPFCPNGTVASMSYFSIVDDLNAFPALWGRQ